MATLMQNGPERSSFTALLEGASVSFKALQDHATALRPLQLLLQYRLEGRAVEVVTHPQSSTEVVLRLIATLSDEAAFLVCRLVSHAAATVHNVTRPLARHKFAAEWCALKMRLLSHDGIFARIPRTTLVRAREPVYFDGLREVHTDGAVNCILLRRSPATTMPTSTVLRTTDDLDRHLRVQSATVARERAYLDRNKVGLIIDEQMLSLDEMQRMALLLKTHIHHEITRVMSVANVEIRNGLVQVPSTAEQEEVSLIDSSSETWSLLFNECKDVCKSAALAFHDMAEMSGTRHDKLPEEQMRSNLSAAFDVAVAVVCTDAVIVTSNNGR